jgi:predicted nucleic acid-binding protein
MPERCIDASVAVKWVLRGEAWRRKARGFLRDSIEANFTFIAPPLYEYETESVLQQRLHSGVLTATEVDTALAKLAVIGVQIVTHPVMVRRAREIARQFNQPRIYDSLYAALAQLRGCEFWTADKAFYSIVMTALPFVRYLPDYR